MGDYFCDYDWKLLTGCPAEDWNNYSDVGNRMTYFDIFAGKRSVRKGSAEKQSVYDKVCLPHGILTPHLPFVPQEKFSTGSDGLGAHGDIMSQ